MSGIIKIIKSLEWIGNKIMFFFKARKRIAELEAETDRKNRVRFCPNCSIKMRVVRIEDKGISKQWIYSCEECKQEFPFTFI